MSSRGVGGAARDLTCPKGTRSVPAAEPSQRLRSLTPENPGIRDGQAQGLTPERNSPAFEGRFQSLLGPFQSCSSSCQGPDKLFDLQPSNIQHPGLKILYRFQPVPLHLLRRRWILGAHQPESYKRSVRQPPQTFGQLRVALFPAGF